MAVPTKILKPKATQTGVSIEDFPIQDPHVLFAWHYHDQIDAVDLV